MAQLAVLEELKDINTLKLSEVNTLLTSGSLSASTSQEIVKIANEYFVELNFLSASKIFRAFFEKYQNDSYFLYSFGYFCSECGFLDLGEQMLKRSVELSPETEFRKYFILGELYKASDSSVALQLFQKGITLAEAEENQLNTEMQSAAAAAETERGRKIQNKLSDDKRTLSQAYCTVAEILMNVPEFPKNKAQVEAAIKHAEAQDPTYLEPIYQRCFLLFNLADENSCRNEIAKFVQGIKKIEKENDEDLLDYPAEMLVGLVRMMIEGAIWKEGAYLADIACTNDHNNYEALYMHAFCALNMEDADTCKECLDKLDTFDLKDDQEIREAIQELKEEYLEFVKNNPGMITENKPKKAGGMDEENDEDWDDIEDDDGQNDDDSDD